MQKVTSPEEALLYQSEARKSSLLSGCAMSNEISPFNSKYTVLKFNKSQGKHSKYANGLFPSESFMPRGLFSSSSNLSFS